VRASRSLSKRRVGRQLSEKVRTERHWVVYWRLVDGLLGLFFEPVSGGESDNSLVGVDDIRRRRGDAGRACRFGVDALSGGESVCPPFVFGLGFRSSEITAHLL
jgi:hypothetical protein